jgi:DnaJ-class molecular chaperone
MDPYKILGVNKNASQNEIKNAFREKALKHHPDKGGNEEKFKQVNEAYSMISDSSKRSQHDAHSDGFGFGFSGRDFSFGDIFGRQKKEKPKSTKDDDIIFTMNLSLQQVKQGMKQKINFERVVACKFCDGEGGGGKNDCGPCQGRGVTVVQPNAYTFQQRTCYHCNGTGVVFINICAGCKGVGFAKIRDSVVVLIKEI